MKGGKRLFLYSSLILVALLLIADILIHFNIKLNPENFNNIATPIISLLGFGVVFLTLLEIRRTNLDNQSQVCYNYMIERVEKSKDFGQGKVFKNENLPIFTLLY